MVGFEQRGCGRSRPLAIEDLSTLASNTTQALIADIETLREFLRIEMTRELVDAVAVPHTRNVERLSTAGSPRRAGIPVAARRSADPIPRSSCR